MKKKEPSKIGVNCPECGNDIVERFGKKGKFYGCSNYPKCKFITNYPPAGKNCPECSKYMVFKELKRGKFNECPACKYKEEVEA